MQNTVREPAEESAALRKHLPLDELLDRREEIEDIDFWRRLAPESSISNFRLSTSPEAGEISEDAVARYRTLLRKEGYFQTPPLLPAEMLEEMRSCIEVVRANGFPVMFALVYDVFYRAFSYFDPILADLLGADYGLVPNFWVYYIEPTDASKGFEPHRDAEYTGTIGEDGLPTLLTLWITLTEATPLNSCMYVLPKDRDPEYEQAIDDLETGASRLALEDIRALPTPPGVLSCWDQYLYHWGSRSSARAPAPRISYALYCQRGDLAAFDDTFIDLRQGIDFAARLGLICRGMFRYSYMSVQADEVPSPLRSFLEGHMAALPSA